MICLNCVEIESVAGTRFVQLAFIKCDSFGEYKGNYQNERLK